MNPPHTIVEQRMAIFAPSFPPAYKGGGPSRSLDALVRTMPASYDVRVLTTNRDHGEKVPLDIPADRWIEYDRALVRYVSMGRISVLLDAMVELRRHQPTILYFNSFFNLRCSILPLILWRLGFWGRPSRILAPRGEFGKGALGRRAFKKRAYMRLFGLFRLDRDLIWHATAEHEVDAIRDIWGSHVQVVLRANDTALPVRSRPFAEPTGPLRAIFLGRLVEHKGLAVLLRALQVAGGPFELDVFGTEEDRGYVDACKRAASNLPAGVNVRFHGPAAPDDVRTLLSRFDVLLMPTAGENFGHVIAEALSVSCPVVTTPTTPWTEILGGGAGMIVADRSSDLWAEAIVRLKGMTPTERSTLRTNSGRSYDQWMSLPKQPHLVDLAFNRGLLDK